jgi:hypothetical protein
MTCCSHIVFSRLIRQGGSQGSDYRGDNPDSLGQSYDG